MTKPRRLDGNNIPENFFVRFGSGIPVIDSLINGDGFVPGQQITIDAPRGSGKTTLMLQILQGVAQTNPDLRVLYLSGEEGFNQLNYRSQKLGVKAVECHDRLEFEEIKRYQQEYDLIVIDSFTCIEQDGMNIESSVNRQREVIKELTESGRACGERHFKGTTVYILQQGKNGTSRGPGTIEHMVDTVISISKCDPEVFGAETRCIEVKKNRFGSGGEVLMKIGRNGWDFDSVIENTSRNEESGERRNTPQAMRGEERKLLLRFMKELEATGRYLTYADIGAVIKDDSDTAAFGRNERHLKEMEKQGLILKVGRGKDSHWELTEASKERLGA